jgi:hypothetical protein
VLIWNKVAFIHRRSRVFLVFNKGVLRVPGLQFSISLIISAGYRKSTVTNSARKVTNSARKVTNSARKVTNSAQGYELSTGWNDDLLSGLTYLYFNNLSDKGDKFGAGEWDSVATKWSWSVASWPLLTKNACPSYG